MKRLFCFILCISAIKAHAQYQIYPTQKAGEHISLESAFSANIGHSGASSEHIVLVLTLKANNGKVLFQGESSTIDIKSGLNYVDITGRIKSKTFPDPLFSQYYKSKGLLPYGKYQACIEIMNLSIKEIVAQSCYDLKIGREQMLQLIFPLHESEVDVVSAYSWSGISAVYLQQVSYTITVVAIRNDQTPEEAVFNNPAHIFIKNHRGAILPNSPMFKPLQPETQYAWQVIAFAGQDLIATSEVWTFALTDNEEADAERMPTPVARSGNMGNVLNAPNQFYFATEDKISDKVGVALVDIEKNKTTWLDKDDFVRNDNSFMLELTDLLGRRKKRHYLLMVKDRSIGKTYFLKLEY